MINVLQVQPTEYNEYLRFILDCELCSRKIGDLDSAAEFWDQFVNMTPSDFFNNHDDCLAEMN